MVNPNPPVPAQLCDLLLDDHFRDGDDEEMGICECNDDRHHENHHVQDKSVGANNALLSKAKIAKFNIPHQDLSIGFICVPGSSPDIFLFWLNHISSPTPVVFQARQMHDDPSEQYTDTCSIVHLYRIQLERTVGLFLFPTFILRSV